MINIEKIKEMTRYRTYLGFGYLGAVERDDETDEMLVEAANSLGLSVYEVFLWANSRCGRKFMDPHKPKSSSEFIQGIESSLPSLKDEDRQCLIPEFVKSAKANQLTATTPGLPKLRAVSPDGYPASFFWDKMDDPWVIYYDPRRDKVEATPWLDFTRHQLEGGDE